MQPSNAQAEARSLNQEVLRNWALPAVGHNADKEDRGHVLVVAGSREIPGAALLSATAALRAGAGKLTIATAGSVAVGLALALPEARVIGLPETPAGGLDISGAHALQECAATCSAVLLGPGLVDAPATCAMIVRLLQDMPAVPCVLDALAMDVAMESTGLKQPLLITPHAGEMAHLTGMSKEEILQHPLRAAWSFAARSGAFVVLKGSNTLLADPRGCVWQHQAAVPGLATSGSGDVLAGVMAGLAARGATVDQVAAWAVVVHAMAGARLSLSCGPVGFLARQLLEEIPAVLNLLESVPVSTSAQA
jgi:ADP-dependent NAD(P)H-hydrate dehydratase